MRSHIARDLHDEIGSTLTSINILSKVSKANIEKDKNKAVDMVQEITDQSQQIQQSMSDIVWAINPVNDKLENMVVRMREYVAQTLEPQNVNIHFSFDEHQGKETLSMRQRRDFFLVFKEAINNAAKYAECKNIDIKLKRENNHIELIVCDDGIGFNPDNITSSNGLKNMKTRAEALQGNIFIESTMNKGTIITLKVPIY